MTKFRKIWNDVTNGFILDHKEMRKDYKAFYAAFIAQFPDSEVTYTAFKNQCSRLGIADRGRSHKGARLPRPLYSEQIKKGYVRIKIAQPNVWVVKAKWVYMETHPWEDFSERSNYVFLDGDNRNFHPDNIERVPLRVMAQYNLMGGCIPGEPELTRLRIFLAKLKMAYFDYGEKHGLVAYNGTNRCIRTERNEKARLYRIRRWQDPEKKKMDMENRKKYHKRRMQDPEYIEKLRKYQKEWIKKKRESMKHS